MPLIPDGERGREQRAPPSLALRNACAKSSLQQIKTIPKIPCPAFAAPAATWVWGHVCSVGVSGSPGTSGQGGKGRNLGLPDPASRHGSSGKEVSSNWAQLEE